MERHPYWHRIERLIGSKGSLRRTSLEGCNWMLIKSLVTGAIDLIRAAIFARILFPSDYGLMALATMVIGILESFSTTGIEVIVQKETDDYEKRLSSYWTIMFIRGCILATCCLAVAGPLGRFYKSPQLPLLISIMAFGFLLRGMSTFGREIHMRKMDFRPVVIVDTVAALACFVIGTIILMLSPNVWALAAYSLLQGSANLIVTYILYPMKPHFQLDRSVLKKVSIFSASLILITGANSFFTSIDVGSIGKLLDMNQVGLYARANFLALIPVTFLANVVAPVFLSTFRTASATHGRLKPAFLKTLAFSLLAFFVCGVALEITSKWIVLLIYGDRWLGVLPAFRIMIIYGCLKAATAIIPLVYILHDKPWLMAPPAGILVATMAATCVPMTRAYGIEGTAWAVVISFVLGQVAGISLAWYILATHQVKTTTTHSADMPIDPQIPST